MLLLLMGLNAYEGPRAPLLAIHSQAQRGRGVSILTLAETRGRHHPASLGWPGTSRDS